MLREQARRGRGPRWCQRSSTGVLFYLSGRTSKVGVCGGDLCVYMCVPGVSVTLPQVLCWDTLHNGAVTAMALDETGWTGQGKGGVKHLSERRTLL